MYEIKERFTTNNEESKSRYKDFIGLLMTDKKCKLYNGEKKMKDGSIVRFVNGLIDGNVYDENGNIILQRAAIEYEFGQEFWTKGYPSGYPAVSQKMGYYEEDWDNGHIVAIRTSSDCFPFDEWIALYGNEINCNFYDNRN